MLASENLPLQLIARTLFEQFAPNMSSINRADDMDHDAFSVFARQLDEALGKRDVPAVRAIFVTLSNLNRETMMRAMERAQQGLAMEASLS